MCARVLLVPLDGLRRTRGKDTFPNLALMRASACHKVRGDIVGFNVRDADRIYVSCIFTKNLGQAYGVSTMMKSPRVFIGGPGAGGGSINEAVGENIDDIMPDYELYGIDYSMGFTSRGCPRSCPFCFVPALEGQIRPGTPIEMFHHPDHKKIILLDNNFTYSPTRDRTLDYIEDQHLEVNFNQGLDVRGITLAFAERLKRLRCFGWTFKGRALHFAWDLMEYEDQVRKGIEVLLEAGLCKRPTQFYVLVGYNTTYAQDLYRIHVLRGYGIDPYVMVYNNRRGDEILRHMARWVNQKRVFRQCLNFYDYDRLTAMEKTKVRISEEISWKTETNYHKEALEKFTNEELPKERGEA